jgi:hypothetical protein
VARWFTALAPALAQLLMYAVVFVAVSNNGSFIGLLALPLFLFTAPLLWTLGIAKARGKSRSASYSVIAWFVAVIPPLLCLWLNRLVT